MTITYPIAMPASPAPVESVFGAAFNNVTIQSLNNTRQVIRRPADLLVFEWTLPPMLRAQAAAWQAFGFALQGSFGTFYAKDPDAQTHQGAATGIWRMKGAGQVGNTIIVDGGNLNTPDVFKAGDWLSVDDRLQMVVADASSDGTGTASLDISPGISPGMAPANNTITYFGASVLLRGIFRLADDRVDWRADKISRYGLSFKAVQAFNT